MPELLHIGHGFTLPADKTPTQKLAFIGQSGTGKTYAAGKVVEELLCVGARVLVIDIVGNWWALTLASNGKGPGFQIPVFGGERGDVPIDPSQGRAVARLAVQRDLSAVIDVSRFRKNERNRFLADFAEELFYLAQAAPTPRMVVIEEAQRVAPQRPRAGDERMLGAVEDLVRLGRNYSLGCMLISQRPQSINKEVLNQTTCLFVGQLSGPHERKAIEDWVVETDSADRGWLKELPSLPIGTMQVWSPRWLGFRKKVEIGKKTTYDGSAALDVGETRATRAPLKAVDVAALRAELEADGAEPAKNGKHQNGAAAVPDRHREDDVTPQLRARIATLEMQLETEQAALKGAVEHVHKVIGDLRRVAGNADDQLSVISDRVKDARTRAKAESAEVTYRAGATEVERKRRGAENGNGKSTLPEGERRTLVAIAQSQRGVTRRELQIVTGYTRRTRDNYLQKLQARKLVVQDGQTLFATSDGRAVLGRDFKPLPTGRALLEHWLANLPTGEAAVLKLVAEVHPKPIARDAISTKTGYTRRTRDNYLQKLIARRLVVAEGRGSVAAAGELIG